MIKLVNWLLIIIIVLLAWLTVYGHYQQRASFIQLQRLQIEYHKLLDQNRHYLKRYYQASDLARIEHYAKKELRMIIPKQATKL